ncbi:MAG: RtcB family protein [Candidatus Nanopelagicales bacterium]
MVHLIEETPYRWRLECQGAMRVPGVVFASRALVADIRDDPALEQVQNVATLPGIVVASYAMPDIHWGYGFPIGGVAATDIDRGGVVSPGGVGFDISCGVRLLLSQLSQDDLRGRMGPLMDALASRIPRGVGPGGVWASADGADLAALLRDGSRHAVARGYGDDRDLEFCEDHGAVSGADIAQVSERALQRGLAQIGSLGSGNHFLEVQVVDRIHDGEVARSWGLGLGRICVMIHCGSRGLGHQICTDHVRLMLGAMPRLGIKVPDQQLACAPVDSAEGRSYLGAMAAAANFGRANRQLLTAATRAAFEDSVGGGGLELLYDVSHNLAKIEAHDVDGVRRRLCVHRKGATRALPPGDPDLPPALAAHGQPVLVPGSMGTASYVLAGVQGGEAFHSTCHGAGRRLSRHAAVRRVRSVALRHELEESGIAVRASSMRGLAEEAPLAYKDVDEVVASCEAAGLARRVARLRPVGVVKG